MDPQQGASPLYRHTQVASYMAMIGLGVGLATQLSGLVRDVRRRKPHVWLVIAGVALFAALGCAFTAITVEITRERLTVGFRRGFLRRRIDLSAIRTVEQVEVPWYYGWGLRLTPAGWLYKVRGSQAVRLTLAGGRSVSIGTDEPARLAAAIEALRPVGPGA